MKRPTLTLGVVAGTMAAAMVLSLPFASIARSESTLDEDRGVDDTDLPPAPGQGQGGSGAPGAPGGAPGAPAGGAPAASGPSAPAASGGSAAAASGGISQQSIDEAVGPKAPWKIAAQAAVASLNNNPFFQGKTPACVASKNHSMSYGGVPTEVLNAVRQNPSPALMAAWDQFHNAAAKWAPGTTPPTWFDYDKTKTYEGQIKIPFGMCALSASLKGKALEDKRSAVVQAYAKACPQSPRPTKVSVAVDKKRPNVFSLSCVAQKTGKEPPLTDSPEKQLVAVAGGSLPPGPTPPNPDPPTPPGPETGACGRAKAASVTVVTDPNRGLAIAKPVALPRTGDSCAAAKICAIPAEITCNLAGGQPGPVVPFTKVMYCPVNDPAQSCEAWSIAEHLKLCADESDLMPDQPAGTSSGRPGAPAPGTPTQGQGGV